MSSNLTNTANALCIFRLFLRVLAIHPDSGGSAIPTRILSRFTFGNGSPSRAASNKMQASRAVTLGYLDFTIKTTPNS